MTRQYAVVGDPVAHSLSPLIHNGWMQAHGLDAHYSRIQLRSADPAADLRAMAQIYAGLNVTLPHKIAALNAAAKSSPDARAVGAANTLVREGDTWTAYNTDMEGFEVAFANALGLGRAPGKASVLLVGAGGAARAAVVSLGRSGARLAIANRSVDNARKLAAELAPQARIAGLDDIGRLAAEADIVVNSASLGHAGASLPPLGPGRGRPFLDLSYGKAAAPALDAAARAGWAPHDGLAMLVAQAAAAFRLWFGIAPDRDSALAACRAELAGRA